MTGLNHSITGSAIAVAIKQPVLALPLAFLSHFATDMIPHWSHNISKRHWLWTVRLDAAGTILIPIVVAEYLNRPLWLIVSAAFLAALPDSMWLPHLIQGRPSPMDKNNPLHLLRRIHLKLQWNETDRGLYYEIAWFILMLAIVFIFKK